MVAAAATIVLALWGSVAFAAGAHGIDLFERRWNTDSGLPHDSVNAVLASREGYLWVGTDAGLARFNGTAFAIFDRGSVPELRNDYILALLEDDDGCLWIGTYGGGVTRRCGSAFTTYTTHDGLPNDVVMALHLDGKKRVWVATSGGVSRFEAGQWKTFTPAQGLPHDAVGAIAEDAQGVLWVGTRRGGLARFVGGRFESVDVTGRLLPSTHILAMLADADGSLWVGTDTAPYRFEPSGSRIATRVARYDAQLVWCLYRDHGGTLWIGGENGLQAVRDGELVTGMVGNVRGPVKAIADDREHNLWVGTPGGLVRLRDRIADTLDASDGLAADTAWSVLETNDRTVWVGTTAGLSRYRDGRFKTYTTEHGLANNSVLALHQDRGGSLWVGEDGGLNRIRDDVVERIAVPESHRAIYAITDGGGGDVWLGTYAGLCRVATNLQLTCHTKANGLSGAIVYALHESRDGSILIGTRGGGLGRLRAGAPSAVPVLGLEGATIYTIHEDADGVLWLGTDRGLVRVEGEQVSACPGNGLLAHAAHAILDDGKGSFWISSEKGIVRVARREVEACFKGLTREVSATWFTKSDGLASNQFSGGVQPAAWGSQDGRLWFASDKGVTIIDPRRLEATLPSPTLVLEKVLADGRPSPQMGRLDLQPGHGDVEFHFAALTFGAPESVRFDFKLEGFDRDWRRDAAAGAAYYTNIPPGEYELLVVAHDDRGLWRPVSTSIMLRIRPHFYQTAWFYVLVFAACAGVVVLVHRLRVRSLRRSEKELLARVNAAVGQIKVLRGLLPYCAWCRRVVRDDEGYWRRIDQYIADHSEVTFTHGMCPECCKKFESETGWTDSE